MNDLTELLGNAAHGDAHSLNQLYDQVYAQLRAIAAHKMAAERDGHTLQPTALVHEAYQRLGGAEQFKFANRAHFFAAAAEAMHGSSWTAPAATPNSNAAATRNGWNGTKPGSLRRSRTTSSCW